MKITVDMEDHEQGTWTIFKSPDLVQVRKGEPEIDTDVPAGEEESADDAVLASIFDRWHSQAPTSGVFELVKQLRSRGVDIVAPKKRVEKKDFEPYVRLVTKSGSGLTVAAYLNTATMNVNRKDLLKAALAMPAADKRENGSVSFDVNDVQGCLSVVETLMKL